MTEQPITYAKVNGPPDDWHGLVITDLESGEEINRVVEVNSAEGWLIRYKTKPDGTFFLEGDEIASERVEGRFEIRRRA